YLFMANNRVANEMMTSFLQMLFSLILVKNPFETHGTIMQMIVITLVIYIVASIIEDKLKSCDSNYKTSVGNTRFLIGSLAIVQLVWILVPNFGRLLLNLWVCAFIWAAWDLYQDLCKLLHKAFQHLKKLAEDIIHKLRRPELLCYTQGTSHQMTCLSKHISQ
ncbi:hypothetical protein P3X46_033999, partial [Hevea brasiliensis]